MICPEFGLRENDPSELPQSIRQLMLNCDKNFEKISLCLKIRLSC